MKRLFLALANAFFSLLLAVILGSVLLAPYMSLIEGEKFELGIIPLGIFFSAWFSWLLIVPGIFLFYMLPALRLKIIPLILVLIAYTCLAFLLELKFILPFIYKSGYGDMRLIQMFSLPYALAYFASLLFFAPRRIPVAENGSQ
jgi:hypothetical protein